ncbi:MAG TPA: carboxylate-amine ligase [Anaerolineales bacterium]|nr:carboxylate-amine ligase [Anaerolineales bacterium]
MNPIPLTLGVEEEYQIIHPETRNLHSYIQQFLDQGQQIFPEGTLKPEFMQSQVEVGSRVCRNIQEVRHELQRLRSAVGGIARDNGLQIASASTHPFARWHQQDVTAGERYRQLLDQMQSVAAQLLIFGYHIHIGFGGPVNDDLKIDVMNQLRYFLPHVLALSTSSPFWQGRKTGLKSYRSVVFEMLPRTGMPPRFNSFGDYEAFVNLLQKVGTIGKDHKTGKGDATKIWWDVRPHPTFGTLEVRIPDLCTKVEEAVCIAAVIQSIVKMLMDLRNRNQSWRVYRSHMIVENKWRAMRYGIEGNLVDFGKEEEVPTGFLAIELMQLLEKYAKELGCWDEVRYIETIIKEGTSADRQIRTYDEALRTGAAEEDALKAVVDQLVRETLAGV